jgi:hypothetical protein
MCGNSRNVTWSCGDVNAMDVSMGERGEEEEAVRRR